ncbi:MAG: Ig-like domain-containing protein, partial [Anaerovoracaceae bacterium]
PSIVSVDSNGLIKALSRGTSIISISSEDGKVKAYIAISVKAITPVESITITPSQVSLGAGETAQLAANIVPENASKKDIVWSSENPTIATVDNTGKVMAIKSGTTRIKAKTLLEGKESYANITIGSKINLTSISFEKTKEYMNPQTQLQLKPIILPADTTTRTLAWTSDNTSIALVNSAGVVTALRAGKVNITARSIEGQQSSKIQIEVLETGKVARVTLSPEYLSLNIGENARIISVIDPSNAVNKKLTWNSSHPNIARVDQNGNVSAMTSGTSLISAVSEDGQKVGTTSVTIGRKVDSISLNTGNMNMFAGQRFIPSVTITPDNAVNKKVLWTS